MGQEFKVIQLFNQMIPEELINLRIKSNKNKSDVLCFNKYDLIYEKLKKNNLKTQKYKIQIYDYTVGYNQPGKIFTVNDHINRIGHNPFIGQQHKFNIDFINVEKLYLQKEKGIITNSCGKHLSNKFSYPSSYLANIAIIASILKYKIEGYLINI